MATAYETVPAQQVVDSVLVVLAPPEFYCDCELVWIERELKAALNSISSPDNVADFSTPTVLAKIRLAERRPRWTPASTSIFARD
jgi:hypothetical protein